MPEMIETLEHVHDYLLDAFPVRDQRVDRYALTAEQVARFERDGYVSGIKVLDAQQLDALRRAVDRIRDNLPRYAELLHEVERAYLERPHEVVCHFLGGWRVDSWLHDLVFSPSVTVPVAQLLGVARLRLWHDQVFYKPARHPGVVPWHQDYSYWIRTAPARHITANILLDDSDRGSGCQHFVPGSHRWGVLPRVDFGGEMDALRANLSPAQIAAFQPVAAPLRAGECSIHHSHIVHGSFGNTADRPRRALVLNYMDARTRCVDDREPLLRHAHRVAAGDVVAGDHFPVVLEAASG